jgi:hypothetical protein
MSEIVKSRGQQAAFWGLLFTLTMAMLRGSWVASEVHRDVQVIKEECKRLRNLEERIIRLEVRVGISGATNNPVTVASY